MKNFYERLGAILLSTALIANVTLLWRFNERLTRIEARLNLQNLTQK